MPLQSQVAELSHGARRLLTGGVLAAHVIGGWALLQIDSVRQAVVEVAPIMVSLIAPAEQKPLPPPPPPAPQPKKALAPAPALMLAAAPSPSPAPPVFVAPAPVPAPPVLTIAAPAPPTPPAPPQPPPAPPVIKQIPASAVRYLVEPRMIVPLLSKRMNESGTVLLRIVVDARGYLKEASVRKSSGFARLDNQALQEIRTARFVPQTENGLPIEWETFAPMAYELN